MTIKIQDDRKKTFYNVLKTSDKKMQKQEEFYRYAYKKIEQNRINSQREVEREVL